MIELSTKPDLRRCLDRVEAWWDCQIIDRPPISISVTAGLGAPAAPAPPSAAAGRTWINADLSAEPGRLRDKWMDVEWAVESAAARVQAGTFFAETFPKYMPNLGPEICATAYGAELQFTERSTWSVPIARGVRDVLGLTPDLETTYWSTIRRMTDLSIQRGAGKWITAVTDLHTNGDLLAALRDPQALCLDFADDPEGVRAAVEHLTPHARLFFDDLHGRIARAHQPCCTWGPVISRRRMYYLSCDFICMISPRMFAETILPALEWEARLYDRTIFHLDGPAALRHLDALLEMDRLNAVQWTYGAGAGTARDWIDVYRRVQAAGKGNEVHAADFADARAVMDHLAPEGIWLCVGGGPHPLPEARAFAAETARWAAGKR